MQEYCRELAVAISNFVWEKGDDQLTVTYSMIRTTGLERCRDCDWYTPVINLGYIYHRNGAGRIFKIKIPTLTILLIEIHTI